MRAHLASFKLLAVRGFVTIAVVLGMGWILPIERASGSDCLANILQFTPRLLESWYGPTQRFEGRRVSVFPMKMDEQGADRFPIFQSLGALPAASDILIGFRTDGHAYFVSGYRFDGGAFESFGNASPGELSRGVVFRVGSVALERVANLQSLMSEKIPHLGGASCIQSIFNLLWGGAGVRVRHIRFIPSEIFRQLVAGEVENYKNERLPVKIYASKGVQLQDVYDRISRAEKAVLANTFRKEGDSEKPAVEESKRLLENDLVYLKKHAPERFTAYQLLLEKRVPGLAIGE